MSALKLSGAEICQAFLDFYSQRGHQPLPSGSFVQEDPTVLLTILQWERLRQRGFSLQLNK
jgi:alanyl-tRNA synthetase